jgi:hypothetical protein
VNYNRKKKLNTTEYVREVPQNAVYKQADIPLKSRVKSKSPVSRGEQPSLAKTQRSLRLGTSQNNKCTKKPTTLRASATGDSASRNPIGAKSPSGVFKTLKSSASSRFLTTSTNLNNMLPAMTSKVKLLKPPLAAGKTPTGLKSSSSKY